MCRAGSLRLDVRRPDYLAPLLGFVSDEFAKVGGREHEWRAPLVDKSRLDLGVGEAGVYLLVELVDDFGGGGPRGAEAAHRTRLLARHQNGPTPEVGQCLGAGRGGSCKGRDFAGLDVRDRRGHGAEYPLPLFADQAGQRGRYAAITHVNHVASRQDLEKFAGYMGHASGAARRKVDLTWIGLGIGDELGNGLGWKGWIYVHDKGLAANASDRRDVADEIEIELFIKRRVDGVRRTNQ